MRWPNASWRRRPAPSEETPDEASAVEVAERHSHGADRGRNAEPADGAGRRDLHDHGRDDVPVGSPYYRFAEILLHRGVAAGCAAAQFCPGAATTRAQVAVFALAAKEGPAFAPPSCGAPLFADVPASHPFCPWIEELARRGIAGGCGGSFCGGAAVTREQMAVFTTTTFGLTLYP